MFSQYIAESLGPFHMSIAAKPHIFVLSLHFQSSVEHQMSVSFIYQVYDVIIYKRLLSRGRIFLAPN